MPRFSYRARDPQGKLIEGTIESADRASAIQLVENRGCVPFRIEASEGNGNGKAPAAEKRVAAASPVSAAAAIPPAGESLRLSHSLRLFFTEQLAYLLSAGMTLDEALGILVRRLKQPALRSLTKSLHQSLVEGRSFSQALREYPRIFSSLYVNLVLAGEASGALTEILTRLVRHLTNTKVLRDRVQQSLIYPAFLAFAGAALVVLFITVMVPQLQSFFLNSTGGGALPLPTRILIRANYAIVHYWWLAAGALFGAFSLFKVATRSIEGRTAWDRMSLSVPGYGSVVRHSFYAQFARTLATLLQNGVTLLKAMELLEDMSGNAFLKARMIEARASLVEGSSLSAALGRHHIFPELFLDMMAVGEQSGRFAETMQMIADVYERELEQRVKVASAIIPPIIIVMIALIVGAVVFGIMSAVFSVTNGLQKRMHA